MQHTPKTHRALASALVTLAALFGHAWNRRQAFKRKHPKLFTSAMSSPT